MRKTTVAILALTAALSLAACNRGSEAARNHEASGSAMVATESSGSGSGPSRGSSTYVASRGEGGGAYAERTGYRKREPIPSFHGEPMWSDNRQHTATENAHYHCDKSGADIGAKSFDDCLTKVHAFLDHPPSGAKTMTRSNGDKLVYDAKANMFAVARKDGAPRTFFKPRDGADYWKQQQAEADSPRGYRSRGSSGGYGGSSGGYGRSSDRGGSDRGGD